MTAVTVPAVQLPLIPVFTLEDVRLIEELVVIARRVKALEVSAAKPNHQRFNETIFDATIILAERLRDKIARANQTRV